MSQGLPTFTQPLALPSMTLLPKAEVDAALRHAKSSIEQSLASAVADGLPDHGIPAGTLPVAEYHLGYAITEQGLCYVAVPPPPADSEEE